MSFRCLSGGDAAVALTSSAAAGGSSSASSRPDVDISSFTTGARS